MLANRSDQTVHDCRIRNLKLPEGLFSEGVDNCLSTPSAVSGLYLLS